MTGTSGFDHDKRRREEEEEQRRRIAQADYEQKRQEMENKRLSEKRIRREQRFFGHAN